ncbi:MAG: AAA family ATPase, partial [Planctomycetota bacterium]|nr:AAA family ATPase [Planctomycetota bacterium]MDI6788598.1 AAA family ATPase [Planctomycetota bacterium]
PPDYHKGKLLRELNNFLLLTSQQGKHTVIIIDEAQAIEDEGLFEGLRLLLNFQLNNRFLLTLLLFGQPELRQKISRVKQLEQRLAVRYHLNHLSEEETISYIKYRCKVATEGSPVKGTTEGSPVGADVERELFSTSAYQSIYHFSDGVPRLINTICDIALLSGMSQQVQIIDNDIIEDVAQDMNLIKEVSVAGERH